MFAGDRKCDYFLKCHNVIFHWCNHPSCSLLRYLYRASDEMKSRKYFFKEIPPDISKLIFIIALFLCIFILFSCLQFLFFSLSNVFVELYARYLSYNSSDKPVNQLSLTQLLCYACRICLFVFVLFLFLYFFFTRVCIYTGLCLLSQILSIHKPLGYNLFHIH